MLGKLHSLDSSNDVLMMKTFTFANAADGLVIDQDKLFSNFKTLQRVFITSNKERTEENGTIMKISKFKIFNKLILSIEKEIKNKRDDIDNYCIGEKIGIAVN